MWKNIFKAVFTITAFSILTRVLGFLLKIFLSREVGAEALGMFQVALSLCMVFLSIISSGLPIVMSKKTAEYIYRNEKENTASLVTACIVIGIVISGIITTLILLLKRPLEYLTSKNIYILLLYMTPCLFAVSIGSAFSGYLWGKKKHFANSFSEFIEQVIRILLSIILISTAKDPFDGAVKATLAMSIACVANAILTFYLYIKNGGKFAKPKKEIKFLIKKSTPITLVKFINSFISPLVAIIIPLRLVKYGFTNEQALSLYGIVMGMTMPLLTVPMSLIDALSTALIPDLVASYANKNYTECQKLINVAISFSIFIPCTILPLYLALGEPTGIFLFDNLSSGIYLEKSAWIMIPTALSGMTGSILNVIDLEVKSSKNNLIGSFLLLLSVWILPKYIDIVSILYGYGICMSVITILNLKLISTHLKFKTKTASFLFKYGIIMLPTFYFSINIFEILNRYFTNFYSLALSASLGFIFYMLVCIIFKVIDIVSLTSNFSKPKKINHLKKNSIKT